MSRSAMASSCLVALASSSSVAKSGLRISSGHNIVCMRMTPSCTRSTAMVIRVRIETVAQQDVGLGRRLVGLEVVGLVVEHRVDLLGRDELLDRDLLAAGGREVLE